MKINGLSLSAGSTLSLDRPGPDQQIAKKSPNQAPKSEAALEVLNNPDKQPGVIRLLQEGHFKGVADVRLRINFFDELQALQDSELRSAANQAIPGFIEAMEKALQTMLSAESLSAEQASAIMDQGDKFIQGLEQLWENSQATPNFSQETLITAVDQAFQELTNSIQSVLAFPEEVEGISGLIEENAGETAPVDSFPDSASEEPEGAATDGENILETLESSYSRALALLQETLAEVSVLPPLSEPEGRGQAYAKFLSIYDNLLEGVPQAGTPVGETVDTVV